MIIPSEVDFNFNMIKKFFAVPAALIIILLRKSIFNWLTTRRLFLISSVYSIFSIGQFLFGQSVGNVSKLFLHRNGTDYNFRGANSLTTEPSFAGHLACALLLLYLFKRAIDSDKSIHIPLLLNIALIAILSKSATGVTSFAIVFLGAYFVRAVASFKIQHFGHLFILTVFVSQLS